jgi:hypothetical protein
MYVTSRKVAGSKEDEIIEICTRNHPGGKGLPARKADNLTAICELRRLISVWASTACYRDTITM